MIGATAAVDDASEVLEALRCHRMRLPLHRLSQSQAAVDRRRGCPAGRVHQGPRLGGGGPEDRGYGYDCFRCPQGVALGAVSRVIHPTSEACGADRQARPSRRFPERVADETMSASSTSSATSDGLAHAGRVVDVERLGIGTSTGAASHRLRMDLRLMSVPFEGPSPSPPSAGASRRTARPSPHQRGSGRGRRGGSQRRFRAPRPLSARHHRGPLHAREPAPRQGRGPADRRRATARVRDSSYRIPTAWTRNQRAERR